MVDRVTATTAVSQWTLGLPKKAAVAHFFVTLHRQRVTRAFRLKQHRTLMKMETAAAKTLQAPIHS